MMKKAILILIAYYLAISAEGQQLSLPYRALGISEEKAIAHYLNRFAFGPAHGQVEKIREYGFEKWLSHQLHPKPDERLNVWLLQSYPALALETEEISRTYPSPGISLIFSIARARRQGDPMPDYSKINGGSSDSVALGVTQQGILRAILNGSKEPLNDGSIYEKIEELAPQMGFKPFRELMYQLMSQKIIRAVYTENQLEEVLVDFWFNHFNVSITRLNDAAPHVLSYERDAIRPHVFGRFEDMVMATAKHPAMLYYLDNANSNAASDTQTLTKRRENRYTTRAGNQQLKQFMQKPGLNENYARELMELHTMGVDGGYTQQDVTEVARAFTGWKPSPLTLPIESMGRTFIENRITSSTYAVLADGFYFDPGWHDAEEKVILGKKYPAGQGMEEGEQVIGALATHPSTAKFIARKMAVRFVSETPSAELIDAMSTTFSETSGDLREMVVTILESEEFWLTGAEKVKSPFETIVSALRVCDVQIENTRELIQWCTKMGQPLYAYQAPTGYPEQSEFWTNGASLINRMNFGLALAANDIPGVNVDLLALNQNHEPESELEGLQTYFRLLLPGREPDGTVELLRAPLSDPLFREKLQTDAGGESTPATSPSASGLNNLVGLLIGSPEFQKQ